MGNSNNVMKYQVKATQICYKYFTVEANDEDDALEKAQIMADEGELHFDDEPFIDMEVNVEVINNTTSSR